MLLTCFSYFKLPHDEVCLAANKTLFWAISFFFFFIARVCMEAINYAAENNSGFTLVF